ncbi:hypothetical protein K466DRAFT_70216 [Polyporus arcularius HHB13444]|uniref:Uncharacterized protein n=1 Tax=Polyporus arcularius HHB13444 TaxID=1314778 RepID=A0A5C3PJG4_9APHY|nr:hypothetical protein K466DRAFT_70216 [Polyporus arcularius HHB13444]
MSMRVEPYVASGTRPSSTLHAGWRQSSLNVNAILRDLSPHNRSQRRSRSSLQSVRGRSEELGHDNICSRRRGRGSQARQMSRGLVLSSLDQPYSSSLLPTRIDFVCIFAGKLSLHGSFHPQMLTIGDLCAFGGRTPGVKPWRRYPTHRMFACEMHRNRPQSVMWSRQAQGRPYHSARTHSPMGNLTPSCSGIVRIYGRPGARAVPQVQLRV